MTRPPLWLQPQLLRPRRSSSLSAKTTTTICHSPVKQGHSMSSPTVVKLVYSLAGKTPARSSLESLGPCTGLPPPTWMPSPTSRMPSAAAIAPSSQVVAAS
ncbi:hypothetical protein ARMGADRAFT_1092292 [Armillaria gallica]|uniref:Uncharacterized protein n=1 Tax=Armillaria gallica TaxID=47427 RepID=A0A2H3CG88_ARMGA|nr:hypothetical protein ARMGADRAFT_1092292 [Armillaria gallica]